MLFTAVAGLTAHMGIYSGVRTLAITSMAFMTTLLILTFLCEDTTYILNLLIQSVGHHVSTFVNLSFQTDAFEQVSLYVCV